MHIVAVPSHRLIIVSVDWSACTQTMTPTLVTISKTTRRSTTTSRSTRGLMTTLNCHLYRLSMQFCALTLGIAWIDYSVNDSHYLLCPGQNRLWHHSHKDYNCRHHVRQFERRLCHSSHKDLQHRLQQISQEDCSGRYAKDH